VYRKLFLDNSTDFYNRRSGENLGSSDPNIFDISDGNVTIQSSKRITVIGPNGVEVLDGGSQDEILCISNDVEYVKLERSIMIPIYIFP
jgi:hypothetical protein